MTKEIMGDDKKDNAKNGNGCKGKTYTNVNTSETAVEQIAIVPGPCLHYLSNPWFTILNKNINVSK